MSKRTTLDLGLSDGKESLKVKTTSIGSMTPTCKTCKGHGEIPDEGLGECVPGVFWLAFQCHDCKGTGRVTKREKA